MTPPEALVAQPAFPAPREGWIAAGIRGLHPAYFALVMATGIVSVACHLLGGEPLAQALFAVNVVAYPVLVVMTLLRAALHPREFFADLCDHQRGVGFFTVVAGTSVLGVQLVVVREDPATAFALWVVAIVLWVLLTYAVFAAFTVKETKPSLAEGINGGWLVAVVATESISNLGGLLLPSFREHREELLFFSLVFWLCGGMLYIWMISLIFYRYTFFKFSPSDLMPPYWINMGAMAISTLAGTTLVANAAHSPLLQRMVPFLLGFTVLFWATATWWIPMLLILAVWRHAYRRFELAYDPLYWGAVFPLGMYTVSTLRLAQVLEVPFLLAIPRVFLVLAVLAWSAAFLGLVRRLVRSSGVRSDAVA
jgi:tellurite resistance protein TehA-like permease